jgi:hypothetical protein
VRNRVLAPSDKLTRISGLLTGLLQGHEGIDAEAMPALTIAHAVSEYPIAIDAGAPLSNHQIKPRTVAVFAWKRGFDGPITQSVELFHVPNHI